MQAPFMRPNASNAMNLFGLFFALFAPPLPYCLSCCSPSGSKHVNGATDVELSRKRGR